MSVNFPASDDRVGTFTILMVGWAGRSKHRRGSAYILASGLCRGNVEGGRSVICEKAAVMRKDVNATG